MAKEKIINKPKLVKILKAYKKKVIQSGIKADKFYLFGSYAKGKAREYSDIDVAVVSCDFGRDLTREAVKLDQIADRVSLAIEPHPVNPNDLEDKWSTLAVEIKKYGKIF